MSVFDKREHFKPFEYPEVSDFKTAIQHSYWLHSEWTFQSDAHEFKTVLGDHGRQIIKDCLLLISQVEVGVKQFWGKIGDSFPLPEIQQVGATFAESEVRHADAYSQILEVLGLNQDFEQFGEVPCVKRRKEVMAAMMMKQNGGPHAILSKLMYFSTFVENISLFAQFAIIKSFNKEFSILKDIDNVVQATQKEETVHAMFGHWLFNEACKELKDNTVEELRYLLEQRAVVSLGVEIDNLRYIFRHGKMSFLTMDTLVQFIKKRLNDSLVAVGCNPVLDVDQAELAKISWFEEELHADVHTDFFHKRPVTYSKKGRAINKDDLF